MTAAASGRAILVATWNIHGCIGSDGSFDLERTARIIRAIDADILALQEVGVRRRRRDETDVFGFLVDTFGTHHVEAKAQSSRFGPYGQLLISRWPMRHRQTHDLTVPRREARSALEALIDTPAGPLHVISTHLGLGFGERRRQIQKLVSLVKSEAGVPCLLMGDFNEWRRVHLSPISNLFDGGIAHRTFHADLPLLPLDRIWCRPGPVLRRSWVWRRIHGASDHLPVLAEVLPGHGS